MTAESSATGFLWEREVLTRRAREKRKNYASTMPEPAAAESFPSSTRRT